MKLHIYVRWGQNMYKLSAREFSLLFLGIISIHFVNTNYSDQKNLSLSLSLLPPLPTYLKFMYIIYENEYITTNLGDQVI